MLILCAVSDIRTRLIPDLISLPGMAVVAILQFMPGVSAGLWYIAQAVAVGLCLWLFARRASLGLGDVKLMALGALALPLPCWLAAQVAALAFCLVGVALAWAYVSIKRGGPYPWTSVRRWRIPLAPFLAAGHCLALGALFAIRGA